MKKFVLDACAAIAYLEEEDGVDVVHKILVAAKRGSCMVFMHAINLLEVYYGVRHKYGEVVAKDVLESVKTEDIIICHDTPEDVIIEAGRFKSQYKISLADSIGLAQAVKLNASFVTADHHELDAVESAEKIDITWIRPARPHRRVPLSRVGSR